MFEKDPGQKIRRATKGDPGNPRYVDMLTLPWTDEVDTADRRRDVAREKAEQHLGGRKVAVNHARDGEGDYFVIVVDKYVRDAAAPP